MRSSMWRYVIMIAYNDALYVLIDVKVWILLVDYLNLMVSYVDDSIEVCRVTCKYTQLTLYTTMILYMW